MAEADSIPIYDAPTITIFLAYFPATLIVSTSLKLLRVNTLPNLVPFTLGRTGDPPVASKSLSYLMDSPPASNRD
jgi:hypothetical protein